jgi:hypothetical protein
LTLGIDIYIKIPIIKLEMDITINVKTIEGKEYSCTFIGDKNKILSTMQEYIKKNIDHQVNVLFNNEEDKSHFTYQELFCPTE